MKTRDPSPLRALVAAALLAAPGVQAQSADEMVERAMQVAQAGFDFGPGDAADALLGGRANERVVKGAPFCAEAQHEQVQWLPDGSGGAPNRIVRQTAWKICRDGEGRTRQEVERDGSTRVYLRDPVARENWVIDPARKTARRTGALSIEGLDRESMRDFGERMRDWAREMSERVRRGVDALPPAPPMPPAAPAVAMQPAPPAPPVPPAPVLITRSTDGVQRETEVRVIRLPQGTEGALADVPAPPAPVLWRARSLAPRGPGSVSPLPPRELEGLRVNGERTTWVIEAGKLGNEKPIQTVREVWTSPELMLTVMSRDFDPRQGEETYRLKAVKRGEPDAALMRVPPDYEQRGRPPRERAAPNPAG
ncbi:MAG: hypothetical protein ING89_13275 [Rubrivivax sp.]|nr:hypothetical protein [Rubrivivax sp.]